MADWKEAAATIWPRRNEETRLPWPLNRLMVARAARLLYMSVPGPANPFVNRFMLECSQIDQAAAVLDMGLGRVTEQFQTGLMLADQDPAFRRAVRRDRSFFSFAVINEPVTRLVDTYMTHFVVNRLSGSDHPRQARLESLVAEIQGRSKPDLDRGVSFREFVHAVLQCQPERQHVLWIPQYLHLKGIQHYDKLYRPDQLELIKAELELRCTVDLQLPSPALALDGAPSVAGALERISGDFAGTPAGELASEPDVWRSRLVDEELRSRIMDYYAEDCRLYDQTSTNVAKRAQGE